MGHFAPSMISRAYDGGAKRFVSLGEMTPVDFAGFSASSRPKREDREIDGVRGLAWRMLRDAADRNSQGSRHREEPRRGDVAIQWPRAVSYDPWIATLRSR